MSFDRHHIGVPGESPVSIHNKANVVWYRAHFKDLHNALLPPGDLVLVHSDVIASLVFLRL